MRRIPIFIILFLSVLLVGCSDNDKFSSDASAILEFSIDSLAMDSVFSQTSTRTYDFWVYNKGNSGVRIKDVHLIQPSKSGFRVNVDGQYVDSVAYDFEVRKGDSIRVFVEMTAPVTQQDEPQRFEDLLVFSLENGREQPIKLSAYSWKAIFYHDVWEIKENTTIDERRPIVITKGIFINKGVTLTISHAQLYFHDGAGIEVDGTLVADSCLFRGDRLDKMFSYLPYDRISGQWKGIFFHTNSTANKLQDCEIRNSYSGISCDEKGTGLELNESMASIDSCRITNTLGDCLNMIGSLVTIDHTTLAQFYPFSADRGVALRFDSESVLICDNTLVTGYEEDVIMGDGSGFVFDTENLYYNFSIKEESPAHQNKIGDLRNL